MGSEGQRGWKGSGREGGRQSKIEGTTNVMKKGSINRKEREFGHLMRWFVEGLWGL